MLALNSFTLEHLSRLQRLATAAGILNYTDFWNYGSNTLQEPVAVVNLGYLLETLDSPDERRATLLDAWKYTTKVLIVAARVLINNCNNGQIIDADGFVTRPNPCETYFTHASFKAYIDEILGVDAIPAAIGVYFVFRHAIDAESFRFAQGQYSSCEVATPRRHNSDDILIYIALYRPKFLQFPPHLQTEIINYFGSWERAYELAEQLLYQLEKPEVIARYCQQSAIGKKLPKALYVHVSALKHLHPLLRLYERRARCDFGQIDKAVIVKLSIEKPKVSYLFYPNFDTEPHPVLQASIQIDWRAGIISCRTYDKCENPPILHRKDAFVAPDYPNYELFAKLTRQEEELGLLNTTRRIGTRQGWQQCLDYYGVEIEGHQVRLRLDALGNWLPKIERHKAAIIRNYLSRPVRLALEFGLFTPNSTFFDYGCGYGGDFKRIGEKGYVSAGWDPYYFPENPCIPADIVNLGYVINVIEDKEERREALLKAWQLTRKVLLVAAMVIIDNPGNELLAYGDGVITRRNTFQKYYDQEELKFYIEEVLGVEASAAGLGIYFVFRDKTEAETFRASRFRSRAITPKVKKPTKSFEECRELLMPLMAFVSDRGRLPVKGELASEPAIKAEIGSLRRAFEIILQATERQEWESIVEKRRQDLLVYLALAKFNRFPKFSTLSTEIKNDIKNFFGSYKQACKLVEEILFSLGDLSIIRERARNSKIGLLLPTALCIHISALELLDPLLRIYEGCASRTIGRMEEATIIKIYTNQPKIAYLFYPDFDTDPHPALHTSMEIDLRNLHVSYRDFENSDDPPLLHCKDACVAPDYPLYKKFALLTSQEKKWGLLNNFRAIKTRKGWLKCLQENCAEIRNYRVYWRKDADPYRVKLLRAARRRNICKPE